jgi:hypothetical protein
MGDFAGRRRARRHVVVDAALLETAMRLTGRGQSETINAALARLAELADRANVRDARDELDLLGMDVAGYPDQAVAGC